MLRSMLFIIYNNDMYNACKNVQPINYADDTTAFISGSELNELMNIINCIKYYIFKYSVYIFTTSAQNNLCT